MQKIFYISFDSLIVIVAKWQNMIEQSYRSGRSISGGVGGKLLR